MTEEDEEFNRIEMESRIKQEYVRAMRDKLVQDLMEELAVARVLIRELGDRLAKLEGDEPVAWRFQSPTGGWAYAKELPVGFKYAAEPLYTHPASHTKEQL